MPFCVCTQKTGRSGAAPRVLHFGTLDFQLTRRVAEYAMSKSALVPLGMERSALGERAMSLTGELSQAGGIKYWYIWTLRSQEHPRALFLPTGEHLLSFRAVTLVSAVVPGSSVLYWRSVSSSGLRMESRAAALLSFCVIHCQGAWSSTATSCCPLLIEAEMVSLPRVTLRPALFGSWKYLHFLWVKHCY